MDTSVSSFEKELSISTFLSEYTDTEKFLGSCKACPNYGKVWSCPPYSFDVNELWSRYACIRIFLRVINYSGERSEEEMMDYYFRQRTLLDNELCRIEKSIPGSLALKAGKCRECISCSRSDGLACRKPDAMRCSIESLGGDAIGISKRLFGVDIQWAKPGTLPEKLTLVGGILFNA